MPIVKTYSMVPRYKVKYYPNNTASFNLSLISIEFLTSWDIHLNPGPSNRENVHVIALTETW